MSFTEHDHMVEQRTPDGADKPLGEAVLLRQSRRDPELLKTHAGKSLVERGAEDPIAIADDALGDDIATCTSDALCMTSHCNPATQTCDGGPGCPPCGATKTCTVEIYRQMCREPMRAPDETKSRTVELKPNGTDGSCVFKAPEIPPSSSNPSGASELDLLVMCTADKPRVPWKVEGTGNGRTLVFDDPHTWGGGGGDCYTDLHRYRCAL